MKKLSQEEALDLVRAAITLAGSQKAFADKHGINPQLLSNVLKGHKPMPPSIMDAVGLNREVVYTRKREENRA